MSSYKSIKHLFDKLQVGLDLNFKRNHLIFRTTLVENSTFIKLTFITVNSPGRKISTFQQVARLIAVLAKLKPS